MPSRTIWYLSKYATPPASQGVGSRGFEIMRELALLGHRTVVVTSDSNHLTAVSELTSSVRIKEEAGVTLCWLRTFKAREARSLARVVSWLHFEWRVLTFRKRGLPAPDIVIASSLSLLTVLSGYIVARYYRVPLIFEVRDIWPLTLTEEGGFNPKNPFVRVLFWVERFGYRRASVIVGTMPNLAAHVEQALGERKSVRCIPMGFSPQAVTSHEVLTDDFRSQYLDLSEFVVGYAGTIGATNALDAFFLAAQRLLDDERVSFLVLGDGPMLREFKQKYGHLPNVTFAPRVPRVAVGEVLDACDVLYLGVPPSRVWDFGQSLNKLIDYMLAGKPILASYSGFPSMIDEAGCGTFVPAGDADALVAELRRYAAMSPEARAKLGTRGREWLLEHRAYSRLAQEYETIIDAELST